MFYTMEEAAVLGGFLELYLDRDSVDPAVRERHRKFRQGLMDSCVPNGGGSMKIIGRWRMPC